MLVALVAALLTLHVATRRHTECVSLARIPKKRDRHGTFWIRALLVDRL